MKFRFILLLFIFVVPDIVLSQPTVSWNKIYSSSGSSFELVDAVIDNNSNIVLLATERENNS